MATMLSHAAAAACMGDGSHNGLLPLLSAASSTLVIYGTARPANPDTATTGQTVLATYTLPSSGTTQSNGVVTLGTVSAVTIANTATAVWFRIYSGSGTGTPLLDGDIITSAGDGMLVSSTAFISGNQSLALTGGTITLPA